MARVGSILRFSSLLLFALALNREGDRVPSGNEFVYLLYLYKAWHPSFLATDWTFQEPTAGHAVFNYAFGWLTCLMSIEAAAWVGRAACWTAAFVGISRVGRWFFEPEKYGRSRRNVGREATQSTLDPIFLFSPRLPSRPSRLRDRIPLPWPVWAGILFWLIEGQSLVTNDWVIGTFEAKCVAYACLLFAIDGVLRGRTIWPGVLCGLAFSLHSAIGLWAGAALGVAVLADRPIRQTALFSGAVIVFSLPGLVTSWSLVAGGHSILPEEAKFLVVNHAPDCFDPFSFPIRSLIGIALMAAHATADFVSRRPDRPARILWTFEITTAGFFTLGVIARSVGWFRLVQMFPMRVYAVFAILFFSWRLLRRLTTANTRSRLIWAAGAIAIFITIPNPVTRLWQTTAGRIPSLRPAASTIEPDDDAGFTAAADWVRVHTQPADVVIAPPWRNDGFYRLRRPLIAQWQAPRYDAMTDWRRRLEAMVGDVSHFTPAQITNGQMSPAARAHFWHLLPAQIDFLRQTYGGNWLITTGDYPYDRSFTAGRYIVYRLP